MSSSAPDTPRQRSGAPAWPAIGIERIGIVGPGLPDWPTTHRILRGEASWQAASTRVNLPPILPPAERRRTSLAVRIALACGHEAVTGSPWPASRLASIFSSSGGDGLTCHQICETLASDDRRVSPTHFHNSVHNAPSGYWGIAMQAPAASTSLCAYDASFAAGLFEAMAQIATTGEPVLLVTYDAPYPEPLLRLRPVPEPFGIALLLTPADAAGRTLRMEATDAPATTLADAGLEALRQAIPTARALPLLAGLAGEAPFDVVLEHLPPLATGRPARRIRIHGNRLATPDEARAHGGIA